MNFLMKKVGTIKQNLPIVNFKKSTKPNLSFLSVVSQLPNKGALPPRIPAPTREAKKVHSEMAVASFVQ